MEKREQAKQLIKAALKVTAENAEEMILDPVDEVPVLLTVDEEGKAYYTVPKQGEKAYPLDNSQLQALKKWHSRVTTLISKIEGM
jgi:hypothetical protein